MIKKIFDVLIGQPLANEQNDSEKYNVPFGLAIMASDAISSVAYASQEILYALVGVIGLMSYQWLGKVSIMIIGLLFILTISYIQIIRAYPQGGGAYVVARENIGAKAGLVAAASLLLDYILTVAVSASAGVAAITSAFPTLNSSKVELVVGLIAILTILNLRGIGESSRIFSVPTYIFIFSMIFMIIFGIIKYSIYGAPAPTPIMIHSNLKVAGEVSLFLILKAFSSGCSALTGLEAISNSVPNFRAPSQKNAKIVMLLLSGLILFIFGGTTILAMMYHPVPNDKVTVVAQIASNIFGSGFMFYVIQCSTAVILLMACNTAFTGFPMLMYVIGKDGYAPRQFTIRGKRLSFSTGIVFLSVVAGILVIIFQADTHHLIPLYSVGVFLSFTLAQGGMVIHWKKIQEPGWKKPAVINGFGAVISLLTALVIASEKFKDGAWIVIILIPTLVLIMSSIKRHYDRVANSLRATAEDLESFSKETIDYDHIIIVPISSLNKATIEALKFARTISPDVVALNVSTDKEAQEKLKNKWDTLGTDILLVTKYSPYRAVITPLLNYIDAISKAADKTEKITVLLPQFITHTAMGQILHNHTGFFIRESLLKNSNIVVSTFPYHLKDK